MATDKQRAANRRNSQNSSGPRNTTRSRYNALQHGLCAEHFEIPEMSPALSPSRSTSITGTISISPLPPSKPFWSARSSPANGASNVPRVRRPSAGQSHR
jgi:hypothetical protein